MGHKVKQSLMSSRIDFFYYAFRNVLLVSLSILVVSALVLSSFHSSAMNSSADSVRINLPTSCTLSGNVTAEHATSMVSGQRKEDIGTTEINTICNDKDGYIVYAKGTTQNNNGEVVLASNLGSNYDIKTGNIPSSNGDSSWAMKLSLGASTFPPTIVSDYDNKYVPVPNNWTKVVYRSASTATNSTATSIFTTTYGVYTTPGQPAGTYSGQVKYVMLHPSTTTVLPTTTLESAFASAGKSKKTGVVDPVTGQTGDFYKMQDMNSSICDAVTPNDNPGYDEIQLVDDRDNKIYWVAKLRDGHCWMTQNLDLDLGVKDTALGIDTTVLTSEDTDLNDRSLAGAYQLNYTYDPNTQIISWMPENTTRDYFSNTGTSWVNNYNKAYSLDPGAWYWDGNDNTPSCDFLATTCDHFSQNPYPNNGTHGSAGNYYNWSATIASDNSSTLSTSTHNDTSKNPQNSICPKGWRLPIIANESSSNEYSGLYYSYNDSADIANDDQRFISSPLWFARFGYYGSRDNANKHNNVGKEANYWSSTIKDDRFSYGLYFQKNIIEFNGDYYNKDFNLGRSLGWSVRCIAR